MKTVNLSQLSQLSQRPASDEAKPTPSAVTQVAAEEDRREPSAHDNSPRFVSEVVTKHWGTLGTRRISLEGMVK